jgi:hypothetical protein
MVFNTVYYTANNNTPFSDTIQKLKYADKSDINVFDQHKGTA